MKDFSAFLDIRRYKNQAHINKIEISENIYLKTCSASFFYKTEYLIFALYPELILQGPEVSRCRGS